MSNESELRQGLDRLVSVLANTVPGKSNKKEWETIRNQTSKWNDLINHERYQAALDGILSTFSSTTPDKDNTKEWRDIRKLALDILKRAPSPIEGLRELVTQLSHTEPGKNKKEWDNIRKESIEILKLLP